MEERLTPEEMRLIRKTLARASEQGWGIALGLVCGVTLLVATMVLVVREGPNPGAHLGLLHIYFPGYRVSWLGSGIGFVYAFVGGYAAGRTMAAIYNRISRN
jgi:hypothetical protein